MNQEFIGGDKLSGPPVEPLHLSVGFWGTLFSLLGCFLHNMNRLHRDGKMSQIKFQMFLTERDCFEERSEPGQDTVRSSFRR